MNIFHGRGLHVLDLHAAGSKLQGDLESIVPPSGEELEVVWGGTRPPAGFSPVALGSAFIRRDPRQAVAARTDIADVRRLKGDERSVSWSVVPAGGDSLAVLLLPPGQTLAEPVPDPLAVAAVEGRIALLWQVRRRPVSWVMQPFTGDPAQEAARLQAKVVRDTPLPSRAPSPRRQLVTWNLRWALGVAAVLLVAVSVGSYSFGLLAGKTGHVEPVFRGVAPLDDAVSELEPYGKSYALVIGIDNYPAKRWQKLGHAKTDAEGMAAYLREQGFDEVVTMFNGQATKTEILHHMQNDLAPRVEENDRVIVFFAGHGWTEHLGGQDWGYIVPYDGGDQSATYISMEELQVQSSKMGNAKHQLFVLDACYSGLLASRGGEIDANTPDYIKEITRRVARQVLAAGGANQRVLDGGPGGHSVFTGYLLEGLQKGLADTNGDGFITFAELVSYVVPRATNRHQTPVGSYLPGHGLGEFVFRVEGAASTTGGAGSVGDG